MEMEFFVPPDRGASSGTSTGCEERLDWYVRPRHPRPTTCACAPTTPTSSSHYSSGTSDVEYLYPIGWSELEGIANRGDFDLTQHAEYSGEKLEYFDPATGERYVPHVIEPAAGVDRAMLAFLVRRLRRGRDRRRARAPCCGCTRAGAGQGRGAAAACARTASPSSRARSTTRCASALQAEYDEGGSIGKRYRRQDEIGTPWCVTIDHQTLEDRTVTVRDRDSLAQERVAIDELPGAARRAARARRGRSPKS